MAQSTTYNLDVYQPRNPKASAYYKCVEIAHRLSTILVLRDGRISEQGSLRERVDLNGEYYHLLQKERI